MTIKPKVIILGAGMSGIACALSLYKNFEVTVYEKSRGVGGRLCAKKLPEGIFHFGAQFCTAQTVPFKNFLKSSNALNFKGSIFDFETKSCIETKNYFVGSNGMHSLLKKHGKILDIRFNTKAIKVNEKKKQVSFESGEKVSYDIIISSLPLPQAREIFSTEIQHAAIFSPCLSVGMTIKGQYSSEYNAYKNINQDVVWIGSGGFYEINNKDNWVLQFSPMASHASMDDSDVQIQTNAESIVRNIIHGKYEIQHSGVFKWKYALCNRSDTKNKFTSISDDAFAVGDWNISPRIESAFISGNALGGYLLEQRL